MSDLVTSYRWLKDDGPAFGWPGLEPRWTSSRKDTVGTAYSASSRVWYTMSHGILNEIYYPTIDRPQTRDMEFLFTGGDTFFHEEKRDLDYDFEYVDADALAVRVTARERGGRYRVTKVILSNPHFSTVIVRVKVEGDEEVLSRMKGYALLAPHLNGGGAGNSARSVDVAGKRCLLAWKGNTSLAMGASCGFTRSSCGFVGVSDGYQDVFSNMQMKWQFGEALNGNIAVMGEIDIARHREFTVAIAFGDGHHAALAGLLQTCAAPHSDHLKRFVLQWGRAASPERLAQASTDGGCLMRVSHNVLLTHEDKTFSGAFIASASIPWGYSKGDDDLGGYHLVWTRDMVQTATALLACGRAETAHRAQVYLACTQQPDGGFAQNFWVDGRPYWSGVQLDEVAFPIILAWRLWKGGIPAQVHVVPFVERAAGFLVRKAPITHQERWEENAGYSPSTLAAAITALICAAELIKENGSDELAVFLEEFADWIEEHLEMWTVTNNGVLLPEVKRHYMRIRPPEKGEAYACESCGTETIHINNRPPGTRDTFEAREIIDGGFLELVRYGVRRADDPLIVDTLKVVDAVLKRELPQGPGWLRYNWDGYGDTADGDPFKGWGQGRPWPLLTGERAHYELAAGHDIEELIRTYENYATAGQMLPEQVWEADDLPEKGLRRGQPAGSASPLVWAHAEYLKLLRSAKDGKVFDRVQPVYDRYCTPEGRSRVRRGVEIYTFRRPIQKINSGDTLRILDAERFEVVWTDDGWKTTRSTSGRNLGSAGYCADVQAAAGSGQLLWTLHWPDAGRWLGYNVTVEIVPG